VEYEKFVENLVTNSNRRGKLSREQVSFKSISLFVFILYALLLMYVWKNALRFGLITSYSLLVLILGVCILFYLVLENEQYFFNLFE